MKKIFIGIDFSKTTFDVSIVVREKAEQLAYQQFSNTQEGCISLLAWISQYTFLDTEEWLFCGEDTGLYSILLADFLIRKGLFIWLENPLQIKQSAGIKREKNDKADSLAIALYACRFQDKARCYQLPDKSLQSLGLLLSFRSRLLRNKHTLLVSAQEIRKVLDRNSTARYIYEQSKKDIARIDKELKTIEAKMKDIIEKTERLKENYELVSSVKGIALINTVAILIHTKNFTSFDNARQFACYAGVVPFGDESGSSVKHTPRISHLANKEIKTLLTGAAKCAVRCDPPVREYYQRKLKEGKKKKVVINNVRNKLIHRIFAVVRNKQKYQVDYVNNWAKTAA